MKDIILLHGALGSSKSLASLSEALYENYTVHTLDFSGHGNSAFHFEGFGIEYFAEELKAIIKEKGLNQPNVFGYSMGGYVALYLSSLAPDALGSIITLGTKFAWNPESSERETSRMNPEVMEEKIPAYTQKLEQIHGTKWKELVWQTAAMMIDLGEEPLLNEESLSLIQNQVLVLRGSEDQMVNEEESLWATKNLQNSIFKSLTDQPHPIEKVDTQILMKSFITHLDL